MSIDPLAEAKALLADVMGHALGGPDGYIPSLGEPKTREIQRRMEAPGITEIVYQPGRFGEHRGPVLPRSSAAP